MSDTVKLMKIKAPFVAKKARDEEIEHTKEEGVIFHLLTNHVRFIGDDKGILNEACS